MLTLAQLETRVYAKMGMGSDSTVFNSAELVRPRISSTYLNVCAGQIKDAFDKDRYYVSPMMRLLAKQVFLNVPKPTTLAAAVAAGASTVTLSDSSAFPATGAIFCQGEVMAYTANAANVLTLAVPCVSDHEVGAEVDAAFAVPADMNKVAEAMKADDGAIYDFVDDRAEKPAGSQWFTVKPGPTSSGDFFWFPAGGIRVRVTYVYKPAALSLSLDQSVLPDDKDEDVVVTLTAGALLYEKFGEDVLGQRGAVMLRTGYANLATLFSQQAIQTKRFRNKVQRAPWRPIPATR